MCIRDRRKATQEMAKELIALYARRQQAQGYAFPEDNEWQRDFETVSYTHLNTSSLRAASAQPMKRPKSPEMEASTVGTASP